MTPTPVIVRLLILREGTTWVGQVLEHDLASQAKTLHELGYEMCRLLAGHVASHQRLGTDPWSTPMAPRFYWDRWEATVTRVWLEEAHFDVADPSASDTYRRLQLPRLDARIALDV